ncbi:MAG TPA: hypothetical protein VFN57_09980 [Thermomicrobiaceae bacterium]|nr:hypothetical protein [Thermomicrobiaceae bacterium]
MSKSQTEQQTEHVSGVSNVAYDVMALLYNKLEAVAAIEEYKLDADDAGDQEFSALLDQLEQQDSQYVDRLRRLLVQRLGCA